MVTRYSRVAIALHWLIAIMILANIALAWIWPHAADEQVRPMINTHKSFGVTVLGLAIVRLLWRFTHQPPAYPSGYKRWEKAASHWVHGLLYFIMFGMPLSGWVMDSAWKDAATHPMSWFGLFPWPRIDWFQHLEPVLRDQVHDAVGASHVWGAYALYALFVLHLGGALKHQLIDRDPELQRMWPGQTLSDGEGRV